MSVQSLGNLIINGDIVTQGVLDGTINPFGPTINDQTPEGAALLASAVKKGVLHV